MNDWIPVAVAIFLGLVLSAFIVAMLGPFQTCLRNNPSKDRVAQCIAIMGSANE